MENRPTGKTRTRLIGRRGRGLVLRGPARRGFTLVELLVVLCVTILLTSLLLPALGGLRDHANRVLSGSNMRQVGMGVMMYATDNSRRLPYSALVRAGEPRLLQEMMALRIGSDFDVAVPDEKIKPVPLGFRGWEGIGLLYGFAYINAADAFYSPGHRGEHTVERYADDFRDGRATIYGNFHYRGDLDFRREDLRPLTFERDGDLVFLTDGMRTQADLNHDSGFNVFRGDGTIAWIADTGHKVQNLLPEGPLSSQDDAELYFDVWDLIDGGSDTDGGDGL